MSKRINLTLPDDIYDLLVSDARRNCRSISEEVTYTIRTHKGPTVGLSTPTAATSPDIERRRSVIG